MAEVGGIRGNADDDKDANGDICCECLGGRGKLNRRYIYYFIRCGFGGS